MVFFLGGLLGFFKIYFFLKFCRALKFLLAWVMFLEHLLSHYWECLSNYSWIDQTITVLNLMNISYHYFQQILNLYVPTHTPTFFFFSSCFVVKSIQIFQSLHGGSGPPAEPWQLHISPAFGDQFLYRSKWVTSDKWAFFTDLALTVMQSWSALLRWRLSQRSQMCHSFLHEEEGDL